MARVTIDDSSLSAIAGAIRGKLDVETTYRPSEMAAAIGSIETGTELTSADAGKVVVESSGEYVLQSQTSRSVSQNGTYDTTTNNSVVVSVSGGGGGSSTPETVDMVLNTSNASSTNGKIIVSDGHAYFNGKVVYANRYSSMKHLMTIPEGYRPHGYKIFRGGGAISLSCIGLIRPDGKVYVTESSNREYVYLGFDWIALDGTEEFYNITYDDTVVQQCDGGVYVVDGLAHLNCLLEVSTSSSKWYNQIITLPQALDIPSNCVPFVIGVSNIESLSSSYTVLDTSIPSGQSSVNMYIDSHSSYYLIVDCTYVAHSN